MENYKIKETRDSLLAIINGSELPISIIYFMLQGLTAEAENLFNKQALLEQFGMQSNVQTKEVPVSQQDDIPATLNDINPFKKESIEEETTDE